MPSPAPHEGTIGDTSNAGMDSTITLINVQVYVLPSNEVKEWPERAPVGDAVLAGRKLDCRRRATPIADISLFYSYSGRTMYSTVFKKEFWMHGQGMG